MKKVILHLSLCFSLLNTVHLHAQYTLAPNDVEFDTISGSLLSYLGDSTNIIIPSHFLISNSEFPVTSIAANSFNNKGISELQIPGSVKIIGEYAFGENRIESLTLEEGIERIEALAFIFNNLEELNLPSTLSFIGDGAFQLNLLEAIEIPSSVDSIMEESFWGNAITSLSFPSSLAYIGPGAFNDNQITSINNEPSQGVIYARNMDGSIDYSKIVSYGGSADSINFINDAVEIIGKWAFMDNGISQVILPSSIYYIEEAAFCDEESYTIDLPNPVIRTGYTFERWEDSNGNTVSKLSDCDLEYFAVFDTITGIEIIQDRAISFYPNPVQNNLSITAPFPIKKIDLVDLSGSIIQEYLPERQHFNIDMQNYRSGVYILRISGDNQVYYRKIVKEE